MSRRTHIILDLTAIVFYSGAIFFISSCSWEHSERYGLLNIAWLVHMLLYGGLGMLLCRFLANDLRRSAPAAMIVAAALATLYGLSDEIHQAFVPGRHAQVSDFIANAAGAVLAVVLWRFFMRRRRRPALLLMAEPEEQNTRDDVPV